MIQAQIKALPEEIRHANLCRLNPRLMDKMGLNPGSLIGIEALKHIKPEPIAKPSDKKSDFPLIDKDHTLKMVLARVWLRCKKIGSVTSNNEMSEIEVDPGLIEYLAIKEGDIVSLRTDVRVERVGRITFHTVSDISDDQESEIKDLIQQARWPVYNGAMFGINLAGTSVSLMVAGDYLPFSVIAPGTKISILTQSDLHKIQLRNDIMNMELAITQVRKKKDLLEREIQNLEKESRRIFAEEKSFDEKMDILKGDIKKLKTSLKDIPGQNQKLQEDSMELGKAIVTRKETLQKLENEDEDEFDLDDQEEKYRQLQNRIRIRMTEIEKKARNVK
ncbi:MAG: hypothetical protein ABIN18_01145 [Pseudomonadota bacterium]